MFGAQGCFLVFFPFLLPCEGRGVGGCGVGKRKLMVLLQIRTCVCGAPFFLFSSCFFPRDLHITSPGGGSVHPPPFPPCPILSLGTRERERVECAPSPSSFRLPLSLCGCFGEGCTNPHYSPTTSLFLLFPQGMWRLIAPPRVRATPTTSQA